jgi:hypothetical protein
VFDEVDKHPLVTEKCETGPIWTAFNTAQLRFDFWVICLRCGQGQVMEFERIRWSEDERDTERVDALELARYK